MLGAASLDFDSIDMTAMVAYELGARYTNPNVRAVVVSDNAVMREKTSAFSEMTQLGRGLLYQSCRGQSLGAGSWQPNRRHEPTVPPLPTHRIHPSSTMQAWQNL